MEERINQALVQLESDLQNLSSAREQVEKTVGASVELQNTVGKYVTSVQSLCSELKTWVINLKERESTLGHDVESAIADIDKSCTAIITSYNTEIDKAKTSFENGTKETLDKYIEENNKLSQYVESLSELKNQIANTANEIQSVKESLAQMSTDLKESQDSQDEALNNILQKVINLPSSIHEEALSVIQSITGVSTSLNDAIKNTNTRLDDLLTKANQLSSNIDGLSTLCQNINSAIISSTTNLTNVITGSKNEIDNKLTTEVGKLDTSIARIKSLCEGMKSSIETFSEQVNSTLDTLKNNEQNHYNAIVKQMEKQENRLNTEFDVVRKQNKIFSITIIVLLVIIIGILIFMKQI